MAAVQGEFWTDVFLNSSGVPYAGALVYHYAAGTSTAKTVWTDSAMATPAAQPVVGDGNGRVSFYGDGDYRLVIKNASGTTLYDFDGIKLTAKAATLRGENQGISYPAATSANRGQLFAKADGSGNITNLALQKDTEFSEVFMLGATLGSTVQFGKGADLASASTLVLGSDGNFFDVTGAVTIEGLSSKPAGTTIWLRFQQVLNLLPSALLVLPYGVAYRTVVNELVSFVSSGAGNWQMAWRSGPASAPGAISETAAVGPDDGHVLCDGSTLSRTTYAGIFARIGTTYGTGAGDGLTFSVPDLRGRSPIGVGSGTGSGASGTGKPTGGLTLTTVARGTWKGEENHQLTGPESGIAAHSHGVTDPGHAHATNFGSDSGNGANGSGSDRAGSSATDANTTGLTVNTTGPTSAASAHNIIQPVLGVTFQMRA